MGTPVDCCWSWDPCWPAAGCCGATASPIGSRREPRRRDAVGAPPACGGRSDEEKRRMTTAAVLLAVALWIRPGPSAVRARAGIPSRAYRRGKVLAGRRLGPDPLEVASSLDVLAVCLEAGMAVSTAAAATAPSAPPKLARVLRRAADLLALGADPAVAWSISPDPPAGSADAQIDALLRLARRSASSGVALARGVAQLAPQSRHEAPPAARAAG